MVASRQRRLMDGGRGESGLAPEVQPSRRDGRAFGRHPRGLKPPGYHQAPLRGDGPLGLGRILSCARAVLRCLNPGDKRLPIGYTLLR